MLPMPNLTHLGGLTFSTYWPPAHRSQHLAEVRLPRWRALIHASSNFYTL